MSTEEHPQHSAKQQYYTEQKQFRKCKLIMKTTQNSNYFIIIFINYEHPPRQGEGHQQKGTGSGPVINARQWTPIKTSKTY